MAYFNHRGCRWTGKKVGSWRLEGEEEEVSRRFTQRKTADYAEKRLWQNPQPATRNQ
jgi:hypothetical protein